MARQNSEMEVGDNGGGGSIMHEVQWIRCSCRQLKIAPGGCERCRVAVNTGQDSESMRQLKSVRFDHDATKSRIIKSYCNEIETLYDKMDLIRDVQTFESWL